MNLKKFVFPFVLGVCVLFLGACETFDGQFGSTERSIVTGDLNASPELVDDDTGGGMGDDGTPPHSSTPPGADRDKPKDNPTPGDDDDTPRPLGPSADEVSDDPSHPGLDDPANRCGSGGKKVLVCHFPPGNADARHGICISYRALQAHLVNHDGGAGSSGDHLGSCQ